MTFTNAHGNAYNLLLFQNTDFALVGDAGGLQNSTAAGSLYISLHATDPGVAGDQTTGEVSTGNWSTYARVGVTRAAGAGGWTHTAASGSTASKMANTDAITFPTKTDAGTASVLWAGIGTSSSGAGVLLYRCPLSLEVPKPFTIVDLTGDILTCPGHGYNAGDEVVFIDVEGAALPSEITEGTRYFVVGTIVANESFRIESSLGGGAMAFASRGSGLVAKVVPKTITQNDIFEIASGKLTVQLR